jgi:phenylpyruvate tautomerase PptA (4-oxalocrotonate tautomerase family)
MPTVNIELQKGRDLQTLIKLRDLVMDSVAQVLKLPSDDRTIRLNEYQPEFFQMKPPYEILIEISMFIGRTKETKKKLYQTIVTALESNLSIDRKKVLITINEKLKENWGVQGGIIADEIALGYNVNI